MTRPTNRNEGGTDKNNILKDTRIITTKTRTIKIKKNCNKIGIAYYYADFYQYE